MAHLEFDPLRYMGMRDTGLADPQRPDGREPYRRQLPSKPRSVQVGDLTVEIRSLAAARSIVPAWDDLAKNAIEPNIFHESAFALAAEQHLPEAAGQVVALVWGPGAADQRQLLALWPMQPPRRTSITPICRGMSLRYASSGAPLLDQRFAVEAASALINGLAELEATSAALLMPELALDGPAARTLRAAAVLSGLGTSELDVHARACLWPGSIAAAADGVRTDGRSRREMNRQMRGLSRHGDVRVTTAHTPEDIRVAMEAYLALEASGWKAERGTSILSQTRDASFYRSMTRALSRKGQISVHLLEAGQRIAAAGLVLTSGGHGWFVKTTYDETLAAHGPGALLGHQIGAQAMAKQTGMKQAMTNTPLDFVDSCAVPGHRMIERLWTGRVRMGDLVIALKPAAANAITREKARRRTRAIAKRFYYSMRGWPM